jgi:hypothetical protein
VDGDTCAQSKQIKMLSGEQDRVKAANGRSPAAQKKGGESAHKHLRSVRKTVWQSVAETRGRGKGAYLLLAEAEVAGVAGGGSSGRGWGNLRSVSSVSRHTKNVGGYQDRVKAANGRSPAAQKEGGESAKKHLRSVRKTVWQSVAETQGRGEGAYLLLAEAEVAEVAGGGRGWGNLRSVSRHKKCRVVSRTGSRRANGRSPAAQEKGSESAHKHLRSVRENVWRSVAEKATLRRGGLSGICIGRSRRRLKGFEKLARDTA